MSQVFDNRPCDLGEGPLWHPERQQLFWFDINNKRLLTREADEQNSWDFAEHVSAAGWVDKDTLLIASETGLWRLSLTTAEKKLLCPLEADNPITRSNDGRADPWGGFWIGTIGKQAEPHAGSIYRFWKGELRRLVPNVTISNAICFAPDRSCAYYTDTTTRKVMYWGLNPETGWPEGEASVFLDFREEALNPDGAVVDAAGHIWIAQWGAARVACYDPSGQFQHAVTFDAAHTSCPAFGGDDLNTLFCTTAREGLNAETLRTQPRNGMTFFAPNAGQGQAEHRVLL